MYSPCFLAFCTGFLSLSLEILWIRLFSYTTATMAQSFAFVLTAYLVGIAIGAYVGKLFCRTQLNLWVISGITLLFASVCQLAGPWVYVSYAYTPNYLQVCAGLTILTALLLSIVFPIAHHLGAQPNARNVGRNVSRVYVSNIIGATLGPLFTGIFLLAIVTTQQAFILCAGLTLALMLYCFYDTLTSLLFKLSALTITCLLVLTLYADPHALMIKASLPAHGKVMQILENEYGIVTIHAFKPKSDLVAGNNAFDGTTNLNPLTNNNHINRVLVMPAIVAHPRHILMIGLSIGTWLKLATSFPEVESIDVVEINPGYLKLIANYPAQQSGLTDPRVHLYIDDGRRWLKAHPNNRYDMIIMNTSFHWRAYASNLLSREFLQIIKAHMQAGAAITYNATGSHDAFKTAASVFNYAFLYENFVIAADYDWRPRLPTRQALATLSALKLDGQLLFPAGSENIILGFLNEPLIRLQDLEKQFQQYDRRFEIVTDQNVITEFKYGQPLAQ